MAPGPSTLALLVTCWLAGLIGAGGTQSGAWQAALGLTGFLVGFGAAAFGLLVTGVRADGDERRARPAVVLMLCATALATGLALGPRPPIRPLAVPSGLARFEAVVEYAQAGRDGRAYAVLRILHGARLDDGALISPGALLSAGPVALPTGARIRVLGKLAPRLSFRNPSPHPETPRRYALQGSVFIASPQAVKLLAREPLASALDALRAHVRGRLLATLPARAAGVARALLLGEGDAVSQTEQLDVRDAGLLHVFAVSGLHVAVLAGLFVAGVRRALLYCGPLARRFEVRRIAYLAGIPLALFYAAFAGGAPSAWRAAITASLGWGLAASGRKPDAIAVTALSAVVFGVLDPREATRPAFLLSIAATAAILSAPPLAADDLRGLLRAAWQQSLRAWLATAPIVWFCFGNAQVVGLLANVVLLPLGSVLLELGALHALLCTLTPLSGLSAGLFALASDAFLSACATFAAIAPQITWPPLDAPQGAALALGAAAGLLARGPRVQAWVAGLTLLALLGFELRLRHVEKPLGVLRVLFVDVGQGDAALVDLPDGRLMLIDAGGALGSGPDPGQLALLPLLAARRRARIDIALLTHPHPDHYGGFTALLQTLPITELWDTGQAEAEVDLLPTAADAARLLAQARARGTRVRGPGELCGRQQRAGGARIRLLWPCPRYRSAYDANDNSLVVRIDYGRRSLLFAGDAEQHAEQELLASGTRLRADVLKVGHHGSRTSTSAPFLHAVAPGLAVISAGAGNRFGHPHAEVSTRLRGSVRHVLNLAEEGGVMLTTDGRDLRVETASGLRSGW